MKKRFLCFLLLLGMVACGTPPVKNDPEGIKKQKAANQIRRKVAAQIKEETGLHPAGTIGQMHGKVEKLGLSFFYNKNVDIVEGRKLLVHAVEAMLKEINQEQKIRPYLCRYPFRSDNIEINIFLHKPDGTSSPPDALAVIEADDGILAYQVDSSDRRKFVTVYKETYEQALERLADPSLPLVAFKPKQGVSEEEVSKLRGEVRFVGDDGVLWRLGENGAWVRQ